MNTSTAATVNIDPVPWWRKMVRPLRHCVTAVLGQFTAIQVPRFTWLSDTSPTLQLTYDDYVHANSIQLRPNGNVLVSARHLDAVFEVDRRTGALVWAVSGPHGKLGGFSIEGDPFGGFSHQHTATIYGEDTLVLFDNGNRFENRASRAVIYRIDWKNQRVKFLRHFLEPNGKQRPATGSAYLIDQRRLIVGWGYLYPSDRRAPQRSVSIFDVATGKETFSMDFTAGYDSYRAKWKPK